MPTPFTRSMRSLELDSFRTTLGALLVSAVLLFGWLTWFVFAEVSLDAVTDTARLEVGQEAHPVEAPVSGRVIGTHLELGRLVEEGDLLVELDSDETRFQLDEKRADQAGLSSQLERLRREIEAQAAALNQARRAETSALDEARARLQQAEAAARLAEEEGARSIRMHEEGLVPEAERRRAEDIDEKLPAGRTGHRRPAHHTGVGTGCS